MFAAATAELGSTISVSDEGPGPTGIRMLEEDPDGSMLHGVAETLGWCIELDMG